MRGLLRPELKIETLLCLFILYGPKWTQWPKVADEVGTLSPLVEVKSVDSCREKSMDSKQECNMTLNRPQAFIQIHYNPPSGNSVDVNCKTELF